MLALLDQKLPVQCETNAEKKYTEITSGSSHQNNYNMRINTTGITTTLE